MPRPANWDREGAEIAATAAAVPEFERSEPAVAFDPVATRVASEEASDDARKPPLRLRVRDRIGGPMLVWLSDVAPEPVVHLWEPYLPLGKLTLFEGDPGLRKSTAALALAAAVTRGVPLLGETTHRQPRTVLVLTAEDGLADTVRPRIDMLGGEPGAVAAYARPDVFDDDGLARLADHVEQVRPLLVIIDPLVSYLGSDVDLHRANEVRQVTAQLAVIAEESHSVLLAIRHLNKGSGKALYRGLGSIDLTAAARSVCLFGMDPDDPGHRIMVHLKSNLAPLGRSVGFRLDRGEFAWTGFNDLTAEDVLKDAMVPRKIDRAAEFLSRQLAAGPKPRNEIKEAAKNSGIAWRTIRRAKDGLNVEPVKVGFGEGGHWEWRLDRTDDLATFEKTPTPQPISTSGNGSDPSKMAKGVSSKDLATFEAST